VHWGLDGAVTATMPKLLALLQMPVAALLVWGLIAIIGRSGTAERRPSTAIVLRYAVPILTAIFALAQLVIVLSGLHIPLPFFQAAA
jgi:hypothetical protein